MARGKSDVMQARKGFVGLTCMRSRGALASVESESRIKRALLDLTLQTRAEQAVNLSDKKSTYGFSGTWLQGPFNALWLMKMVQ